MMARAKHSSKSTRAAFKAAVALSGSTQTQFAESLGVTVDHLMLVLRGKRESPRISAAVSALIAKHLPAHITATH
jgi:transcriptional regulator with XRE-family HTH domain